MKYVPRSYIADDAAWDEKVAPTAIEVVVTDGLHDTGLLDANGIKLYRVRDRAGFLPSQEN